MDKETYDSHSNAGNEPDREKAPGDRTIKGGRHKKSKDTGVLGQGPPIQVSHSAARTEQDRQPRLPESTILTWQDLADLPKQVLPEETYLHLKNARREAALAIYSLWTSINKSRRSSGEKTRKRIEVE